MDITTYLIVSFFIILIFSIILSVQDIKRMSVDIYIQWVSIFVALACHLIFARETMWIYILSSMFCGAFYFAVRKITKDKLGPADVWFGFFQGLFLIPKMIPVCFGIECLTALCVINKRFGKVKFPFIPFMATGLIAAFLIQVIFM
ncbi:MAG: hypothetical protein K6A15_03710 [Treponema sp.]|nr:hypothetical protein [Treponema sp.]